MNIVEQIRRETAGLMGNQPAVVDLAGEISREELWRRTDALCAVLKQAGIQPLDRVGLALPDSADYICLSLALLLLGATVVPVPFSSTASEVEELVGKTSLAWTLSFRKLLSSGRILPVDPFLGAPDPLLLAACSRPSPMPEEYARLHPAFIRFSSGTTGESKGVLLSHEAIDERTAAADQALRITPEDTILWVLPMGFHFVVSILLFLRRGATIWVCSGDFPFSLLSAVRQGRGTFIYATPFHYRIVTETGRLDPSALSRIRMAVSTAMKLPPDTARTFKQRFGLSLTEAYGIIEVGLPFVNGTAEKPEGSVGRPLPGYEVKIESPDADGCGEVLLRGPGMYSAYLFPWQPRSSGDWFHTGDTGQIDEQGFLYLLGRTKQVINFAGMKIFPYEVEAVLEAVPGVHAAWVYAEEHPHYGQLPCANVEAERDRVTPEQLQRICYEQLAGYKVPKKIEIVPSLERTPSGKIKRSATL